ncbi:porin family protein [Fulvivirga sp. M361]|uniref:porin family protein n=1 Tax=Fulvivirga sp. M361 TaxID=2594266 RepID=UPI00117ACFE3|nr:porin family protein [Fulvivirga sp. M361]TRX61299.1 porin family protein [Fulvivirga sp. M361]
MKIYKITSFTLFLLISFCITSYSQENYFGLKGGANFVTQKFSGSGISGSSTPDRAIKPHFGILYNAMVSDKVAIQPELQYSGHGFKPVDNSPIDKIDFNYIALPVMVKYYFNRTVNIHGGPELSYLVDGTSVNGVSITEETTSINLALAIGLEVFIEQNITLVGRYIGGVVDIDDTTDLIDQKTNNLQVSLVFVF